MLPSRVVLLGHEKLSNDLWMNGWRWSFGFLSGLSDFPRAVFFLLNTAEFIAMRWLVVVQQRHKSSQILNHSKVTANPLGMRRSARFFYLFDVAAKLFTSFTTRETESGCSGMNFDAAFNSIWSARGASCNFQGLLEWQTNGTSRTIYSLLQITRCLKNCSIISKQTFSLHPSRACIMWNSILKHTLHNKYRWRMRLNRTECMLKINYYFPSLFMLKNSQHKQVMYGKSATRSPRKQSFATYLLICYSELQQGGEKMCFCACDLPCLHLENAWRSCIIHNWARAWVTPAGRVKADSRCTPEANIYHSVFVLDISAFTW